MTRLYLAFCLVGAFDISPELGYLVLAVIALNVFHKGIHKSRNHPNS